MIKSKITRLFIAGTAGLLISCNTTNNSGLEQTINEVKDGQQVILKKIASLEKSIANIAVASKNKPAANNNKKQQYSTNNQQTTFSTNNQQQQQQTVSTGEIGRAHV